MRTIILILLCLSLVSKVKAQSQYAYTAFNGTKYSMNVVEKKNVVLLYPSEKVITSKVALDSIASRADRMYDYYKNTLGIEPSGGLSAFSNKCPVAFVYETCGAACGLIGAKGIEVGQNYLDEMVFEYLNNANRNRIGIIGYEFGRNFYTSLVGSKLSFSTDNSIITNGFATFMSLRACFYANTLNESTKTMNESYYFYNELYNGFISYLVRPDISCEDFLFGKKKIEDSNHIPRGIYTGACLFVYLDSLFRKNDLHPKFWQLLKEQPDAKSDQDALDNFAVCTSKAIGADLTGFFNEILKFHLSPTALSKLNTLPKYTDYSLVRDIKLYEIFSLKDNVNILTSSLAHGNKDLHYKVVVTGNNSKLLEETTTSTFFNIPIEKCFSQCGNSGNRLVSVYSYLNVTPMDSFKINIHYRDTISTHTDFEYFVDNSYFSSYYGTGFSKANKPDKTITIFAQGNLGDDNRIEFYYKPIKDRNYTFSALIKTSSKARAFISYQGGIGSHYTTPVTTPDTVSWVPISYTFNTNMFDTISFRNNGVLKFNLCLGNDVSDKVQFAYFKDVKLIDVTASSVEWNKKPTKPVITFDTGYLKSSYTSGNQWFFNDQIINGATNQNFLPTQTGEYSVSTTNGICTSEMSNLYKFIVTSVSENEKLENIRIFPNPTTNILTIQTGKIQGSIHICDISGRCLMEQKITTPNVQINVSSFSQGIYVIKVISAKQFESLKFIKE